MAILLDAELDTKGADYPVTRSKRVKGSPQNCATKAELDAVHESLREAGQIGQVTADGTNTGSYTMSPALLWVKDAAKISTSQKGVANGVATLGADGIVPASQLPSVTTAPPAETPAQQGVTFPAGVPSVSTLATYAEIPDAQASINGTLRALAHFSELYGANMPATGKHRQVAAVINFATPTAPFYALKYGGVENIANPAPPPTVLDHEKWLGGFVLTSEGASTTPATIEVVQQSGTSTSAVMSQDASTKLSSFIPTDTNNTTGFWAGLIQNGRVLVAPAIQEIRNKLVGAFTFASTTLTIKLVTVFNKTARSAGSLTAVGATGTITSINVASGNTHNITVNGGARMNLTNLAEAENASITFNFFQANGGGHNPIFGDGFEFIPAGAKPSLFGGVGAQSIIQGQVIKKPDNTFVFQSKVDLVVRKRDFVIVGNHTAGEEENIINKSDGSTTVQIILPVPVFAEGKDYRIINYNSLCAVELHIGGIATPPTPWQILPSGSISQMFIKHMGDTYLRLTYNTI